MCKGNNAVITKIISVVVVVVGVDCNTVFIKRCHEAAPHTRNYNNSNRGGDAAANNNAETGNHSENNNKEVVAKHFAESAEY